MGELALHLGQEESRGHASSFPLPAAGCMHTSLLPKSSHVLSKQSHQPPCTLQQGQPQSQVSPSSFKTHLCHTPATTGIGNRQWWRERDADSLVGLGFLGWGGEAAKKLQQSGVAAVVFGSSLHKTNRLSCRSPSSTRTAEGLATKV